MNTTEASTTAGPDTENVEPFICHLYPRSDDPYHNHSITFCGLHVSDDPHALMHKGYGQKSPKWGAVEGPGERCPACGAPLCATCLRRV